MIQPPYQRVKEITSKIQKLQEKLMNASFMPMAEQQKLHEEIRKLREEMALLERRTRASS